MRTRSTNSYVSTTSHLLIRDELHDSLIADQTHSMCSHHWEQSYIEDVVTPNFKKKMGQGELIINPMTSAKSQIFSDAKVDYELKNYDLVSDNWQLAGHVSVVADSAWSYKARFPTDSLAGILGGPSTPREALKLQLDYNGAYSVGTLLLARAVSSATSSEAMALVTLAEMDKTISMVSSMAQAANKFCRDFERAPPSSRKEFKAFLKRLFFVNPKARKVSLKKQLIGMSVQAAQLASLWLGFRYGIMATYYDVASWLDGSRALRKSRRMRYRSNGRSNYDSGLSTNVVTNTWHIESTFNRLVRSTKSSAGCVVQFDLETDAFESYGVLNVLSTAWELVPFSFVLDWFVDASERIAAIEGKVLRPVLGSWIIHRHGLYRYQGFRTSNRDYSVGSIRRVSSGHGEEENVTDSCLHIERIANPTLSPLPQVRVNLNWKRLVDSAALLTVISKKMRGYS